MTSPIDRGFKRKLDSNIRRVRGSRLPEVKRQEAAGKFNWGTSQRGLQSRLAIVKVEVPDLATQRYAFLYFICEIRSQMKFVSGSETIGPGYSQVP